MAKPSSANLKGVQPTQFAKISIALQPECRQLLQQTLHHLSDPSSQRYGQYLDREEAKALLRPQQDSTDAVYGWLSKAGIPATEILIDGQFIHVQGMVKQAQVLLGVSHNLTLGTQTIAVSSLPEELGNHVTTIQYAPIQRPAAYRLNNSNTSFARRKHKHGHIDQPWTEALTDWEECESRITPGCLRRLYHVDNYRARHGNRNLFGIVGFNGYDQLKTFLDDFAPYAATANFTVESPAGEANADIQYAVAMAYDVPVRFYATGGENHDTIPDLDLFDKEKQSLEPFLEFASHLLNLDDYELPKVVSISYGANEQLFPKSYAQQVCDMFGQLGTRGVSIIGASGDLGPSVSCQSNDGTKRPKFMPSFPATCPYVTSVGATYGVSPEIAAKFSSGGFSDYFARPKWQDEAVGGHLKLHGEEWKSYYNPHGRGFPDVAAQGVNYRFWSHGNESSATGTSCSWKGFGMADAYPDGVSSPTFAALIALLNDYRSKDGLPSMGFLNPWIYSIGSYAFTDITESKSMGCSGHSLIGLESPTIPSAGWNAVLGWDPVTGWGTPLFDRLNRLSCV
ncbi:peptidase S8/S53 domain-containing protein [Trichoderma barbatum]